MVCLQGVKGVSRATHIDRPDSRARPLDEQLPLHLTSFRDHADADLAHGELLDILP